MKPILRFIQNIRNVYYVQTLNNGNRSGRRRAKRLIESRFAK